MIGQGGETNRIASTVRSVLPSGGDFIPTHLKEIFATFIPHAFSQLGPRAECVAADFESRVEDR